MTSVRDRINEYLSLGVKSQAQVAREIGVSASAISTYSKGTYGAKNAAELENKITQYLDKIQAREAAAVKRRDMGFVPTSNSKAIFTIADRCRINQEIGVVVGEPGLGKTTAIREYAATHVDAVPLYCHHSMTMKGMFVVICEKLGLDTRGKTETLFRRCADRLGQQKGLLMIDEVEQISVAMLDELRRFNDPEFGGSGVLLVGLPRFVEQVTARRYDFKYLYSRISQQFEVFELPDHDIEAMVKAVLPDEASGIWRPFARYAEHNPRKLVKLLDLAITAANSQRKPIDEAIIQSVSRHLVTCKA